MMSFINFLSALIHMIIGTAHAGPISESANNVASGLWIAFGGGGFLGIVEYLRARIILLFIPVGVLILVRAGLRLITSQDEDKLTTARQTIASTVVGIVLALISNRLVEAFYTPGGTWNEGSVRAGATILAIEVGGIINWVLVLLIAVAILMIVATGLRAIGSFGKEDGPAELRRTVAGVVTGIGMILIAGAVKLTLGLNPDITPGGTGVPDASIIILRGIAIIQALLSFMALIAVTVIIYAGLMMILNVGDEDQFKKAKELIQRALIGLLIILLSGVIAIFVANLLLPNPVG